jgi:hypothetical protein
MTDREIVVDDGIANSDWVKANAFDFPSVKSLADFEKRIRIPSEPLARQTALASYAGMAWMPVAPPEIRLAIISAARKQDLEKASFGGDRSAAGRYAANMRWKNNQPLALHRQQLSKGSKTERELSRLLREQSGRATEQDAFVLKDYSQYGHKTVNGDLRGKLIADLGKPVIVRGVEFEGGNTQTSQTLEAFDRVSTPTATDMTVYRGMKVNLDKEFRVGERFMDRGFSSTSSEMLLTQPFGKPDIYNQGVIMEISVPQGTRVVANDNFAMRGDSKKEDFYYEKEIILGPQTKFEVVSVAKVDQKVIFGGGKFSVTIVKVEVVK